MNCAVPPGDRNFDDIAEKFQSRVYGSEKGRIRLEILRRDLQKTLDKCYQDQRLNILDAGGGGGNFSVELAQADHRTTLCDISAEMLIRARALFAERAPTSQVRFINDAIQNLAEHLNETFDVVLFHAVLEWLEQPRETLEKLLVHVKPGGLISILFYNRHGLVMQNLLRGSLQKVRNDRIAGKGKSLTPTNPADPIEVLRWFQEWGYTLHTHSGVRCFADFMPVDIRERCDDDLLIQTELQLSGVEPYRSIARYVHMIFQKPGEGE